MKRGVIINFPKELKKETIDALIELWSAMPGDITQNKSRMNKTNKDEKMILVSKTCAT